MYSIEYSIARIAKLFRCSHAIAQVDVGEDIGRAAKDRGTTVDGGVPCHHADIFGTEVATEFEELLIDQRLDRVGVNGLFAL